MGIFQSIVSALRPKKKSEQARALSYSPYEWLTGGLGGSSVSHDSALGITAFWRAVLIIAENIASLPIEMYRYNSDGTKEAIVSSNVKWLLSVKPSPLYDAFKWKMAVMGQALVHGNSISVINRDGNGRPSEIRIIDIRRVSPVIDGSGMLFFRISGESGKSYVVDSGDVVHIAFNPTAGLYDGYMWGQDPVKVFRETLSFNANTTKYGARIFEKGTHFKGFLTTDQTLSKEAAKSLKELWSDWYAGVENFGVTPLLHSGLKWQGVNMTPEDAMFDKTRTLNVQDVSRIFGVPLHMLSSLDRATFNNSEQQNTEFVTFTLRPWVKQLENEFRLKLLTERSQKTTAIKFNLNGLLRGDAESRAAFYRVMMNGIMTANEIRALEGLNPIEGGDVLLQPMNMTPANEANNE